MNITEVLDRHENIRHILQVLVDTNSQLFQMRKWERKPDSVILVNVKCLMHSACPTMRETIPFYVFFSAFNKRVCRLSLLYWYLPPNTSFSIQQKENADTLFHTVLDLLVQRTPSRLLCKQVKNSDVCAHIFTGEKKNMKVGGTSLLN